ncbi:glycosyltransferase family 4 protein [Shewanella algae]|uniref:glycosyltransferase family 4 protein n=1 Tax=Shewanella algae TaxID=38313 RepID=UPI00313BE3DE
MKKKVLIIYNKVWSYRRCIFDSLAERYDLTIAVNSEEFLNEKYPFKVIFLPTKKIGPFQWHLDNLGVIMAQYDCIIGLYDIRWLRLMLQSLTVKRPVILWGIGVTASYENHFDSKQTWDKVRVFFAKRSAGVLLYSDYPVERHIKLGVPREKIWVAHNTTDVDFVNLASSGKRRSILFVGSLYKEKRILDLVKSYIKASSLTSNLPEFDIVGDGEDFVELSSLVKFNSLENKIRLHGSVYDNDKLSTLFSQALVCISPNQAGLSVLKSMGFGVPFATNTNAITGGEIFNIKHMVNGVFIDQLVENMEDFFLWTALNQDILRELGANARKYYLSDRIPSKTVDVIVDAIESSL